MDHTNTTSSEAQRMTNNSEEQCNSTDLEVKASHTSEINESMELSTVSSLPDPLLEWKELLASNPNRFLQIQWELNQSRSLINLELPFYSTNMKKVMETIGGISNLQHLNKAKSQFLPVRLRPTEPSCKPLFADLKATQSIVIRLKRHKKHKMESSFIGIMEEKYVCDGMADFQYFTATKFHARDKDRQTNVPLPTYLGTKEQQQVAHNLRPYLQVKKENDLELLPEVFSKVDLPLSYEFRQRSGYQPSNPQKKRSSTMTYLNFHDTEPAPTSTKLQQPRARRRPIGSQTCDEKQVMNKLKSRLEEKPIWLRMQLLNGFDTIEKRYAQKCCRILCYVFVDGPWRGCWIKIGYDPRTSLDAAVYQVVELRNNRELVYSKVMGPQRKRIKKFLTKHKVTSDVVDITDMSQNSVTTSNPTALSNGTRISKVTQTSADLGRKEYAHRPKRKRLDQLNVGSREYTSSINGENGQGSHLGLESEDINRASSTGEDNLEIFGVPLTSASVLFQLADVLTDTEIQEWVQLFQGEHLRQKPTLLGGWFSTHMFQPLREMIRCRIAQLVGRSSSDLENRRKRIETLKEQALIEFQAEKEKLELDVNEETKSTDANSENGAASLAAANSNKHGDITPSQSIKDDDEGDFTLDDEDEQDDIQSLEDMTGEEGDVGIDTD